MSASEDLLERACPYCGGEDICEHLLLLVDLTFRKVQGGAIDNAFEERWWTLLGNSSEDPNFDEGEAFQNLLDEVMYLADAERDWETEEEPGISSYYQAYYSKNVEAAEISAAKWISKS